MSYVRGIAALIAIAGATGMTGCASLEVAAVAETHRLQDAPYYIEITQPQPARGSCATVLPISLDPEFARSFGYAGRAGELEPLIDLLNERIALRHGCTQATTESLQVSGAPRVYVGSAESDYAPRDVDDQRQPGDRFAPMVLHLERPGAEWRAAAGALVARSGVPYAIAIQLGVSQYMKGYSGVFTKEVALGTGYRQPIQFLTAEDKPVEVLHLTGVLVDQQGRVVRAGAEGIVLRDTPFLAQTIDVTRTLDAEELQRVLHVERRTDLAGSPLKIDVALDNLIAQLTRGEVRVPAK